MKNKSFKKLVSSLLIAVMLFSSFGVAFGATASATSDIKGHWAESQISAWIDKGFIKGYEDDSFKPDNTITRAEFFVLINRSFGFTETAAISFSDVQSDNWAYSEVAKAVKAGYITGYADGTIGANKPISRQEVAAIVDRLLGLTNSQSTASSFSDSGSIASWAKGSVDAAVAKGILKGYAEDNSFKPDKSITRAEAVVTLDRAVAAKATVYNAIGTYGPVTGTETINGNVVINVSGVTLQNTIITGDLTLAEGIGNGDAFLNNVTVKGQTNVNGGGENSIHLKDSVFSTMFIHKPIPFSHTIPNDPVRVVAEGTTTVKQVNVQSGPTKLEEAFHMESGFSNVTLTNELPDGSMVILAGSFTNVDVQGDKTINVNLPEGTIVDYFKTDTTTNVIGKGTIDIAEVGAGSTTTFETKPNVTTVVTTIGTTIATPTPAPTATPAPTTSPSPTPDSGSGQPTKIAPSAPKNLTATPGDTTVGLTWASVTGATYYKVYKSNTSGTGFAAVNSNVTVTNYNVTGLTNGAPYYFVVKAANTVGESVYSSQISSTPVFAPPIFTSATTSVDGRKVILTFDKAMADPSGKHAEFAIKINGFIITAAATAAALNGGDIELTLPSPIYNGDTVTVAYAAGSVTSGDTGILATFSAQSVSNIVPVVPVADFANSDVTSTTVNFTWTLARNATSVTIQQSPTGTNAWTDSETAVAITASEDQSAQVTGLSPVTGYDFRLVVVGGRNAGNSNTLTNTVTKTTQVSNFSWQNITSTTVDFTWAAATSATSVKIQQSLFGTNTWTDSATAVAITASDSAAQVTGLSVATGYDFRLVVVGGANAGNSNTLNGIFTSTVRVADFVNTAVTSTTVTFTWSAVTNATSGVNIQQKLTGTNTWTNSTAAILATDTTAQVTGLSTGTGYDFRLMVVSGPNAGSSNILVNVVTS